MTQLEHRISVAQRRLWFNRWLHQVSWSLTVVALIFAAVVLIQRLLDLNIPLFWVGAGLGSAGVAWSVGWTALTREGKAVSAARLDDAAGLRERLSSGRYCLDSSDPFARAVVVDAERISSALAPRKHIPLRVPQPLAFTVGSVVVAALMFLVSPGLLKGTESKEEEVRAEEVRKAKAVVKQRMEKIEELIEATPVLADLKQELTRGEKLAGVRELRQQDVRHEAAKRIDSLSDLVKKKRTDARYEKVQAMRKMLRGLKSPKDPQAATQKLNRALAKGDFKSAKEELNKLKEQLATLKSDKDQEMVKQLSKQLSVLAKQLEQLATNEQLAKKLQQAGLKKEDVDRLLENLKKKDLDQLRKQLAEKGFNQQQIKSLAKQLQQNAQASSAAKQLAKSMQSASKSGSSGQADAAMAGLSAAGQQLSELEQLEQEMGQLDAALADLQAAKNDMDQSCPSCGGTGKKNGKMCGG